MIKIWDFIFPSPENRETAGLYAHCNGVEFAGGAARFKVDGVCSFDTYFNCFSYSKYHKYTIIDTLQTSLEIEGEFEVELIRRYFSANGDAKEKTLAVLTISSQSKSEISAERMFLNFTEFKEEGYLFIRLKALTENCVLYSAAYYTAAESINDVKIGINVCTFKREKYVAENLKNIKAYFDNHSEVAEKYGMFIIDNGKTLADRLNAEGNFKTLPAGETQGYPIYEIDGINARIYENPNTGGSGGFTRGMKEIRANEEYTHFLNTDDDIVFCPEILKKLLIILQYTKDPENLSVGGAMFYSDKPAVQYEAGAVWNGYKIDANGHDLKLSSPDELLENEKDLKADYNAWWFFCAPITVIDRFGLPLPLFIKSDDVEYGMRCGLKLLVLNGLGVWHENFKNKFSEPLEYYSKRNELILNAVLKRENAVWIAFKKLLRSVGMCLVDHHYYGADMIFKAYDDFLKGPKFLYEIDAEKLNSELRAGAPVKYNAAELKARGYDVEEHRFVKRGNKFLFKYFIQPVTLNGYLIPSFFYDREERKNGRYINPAEAIPIDYFMCAKAVQYNPAADSGFVTVLKRRKLFSAGFRIIGTFSRFILKYRKVGREWEEFMKNVKKCAV